MSYKERLLHMVLFELGALTLMITFAMLFTGDKASQMTGIVVVVSLINMAWNYLFNCVFDRFFGSERVLRKLKLRIFHGVTYETGFVIISVPILMWIFKLDFMTALLMDAGLMIFYILYAIGFNWAYDVISVRIRTRTQTTATTS